MIIGVVSHVLQTGNLIPLCFKTYCLPSIHEELLFLFSMRTTILFQILCFYSLD